MPVYYFFLIIKIGLSIFCLQYKLYPQQAVTLKHFLGYYDYMNFDTIAYLIFTNIFVIGQDICIFLGFDINSGSLFFTPKWWATKPIVFQNFYFIPQAWTLGLELTFYLIAPFIVRKNIKYLILALILSLSARFYIYYLGYKFEPWTHCFFPLELAMFLTGSLSYKLYSFLNNKRYISVKVEIPTILILLITTLCYPLLPNSNTIPYFFNDGNLIYYIIVTLSLPFLFELSKRNKIDRFIGELSYPLYLCHLMIIHFFGYYYIPNKSSIDIFIIISTSISASVFAVLFILKPIDKYRQARCK